MANFKQGEDKNLKIAISKNNLPIDLTGAQVKVSLVVGNISQGKYTNATPLTVGYKPLVLDTVVKNQINISLDSEDTTGFSVGTLSAQVQADFVDASFTDGKRTEIYNVLVGAVEKGNPVI